LCTYYIHPLESNTSKKISRLEMTSCALSRYNACKRSKLTENDEHTSRHTDTDKDSHRRKQRHRHTTTHEARQRQRSGAITEVHKHIAVALQRNKHSGLKKQSVFNRRIRYMEQRVAFTFELHGKQSLQHIDKHSLSCEHA
jgi:hypothetical protein